MTTANATPLDDAIAARQRGNYAHALKIFKSLAAHGDAKAQYNLGLMYRYAYGVLQDYTSAHMWLNLASAGGSVLATEMRDKVTKLMTPQQIEIEQDMARAYQEKNFKGC